MPLDAEYLVDRRRLRRRLSVWRAAAFLFALAALLIGGGLLVGGPEGVGPAAPQVARVAVDGLIIDDRKRSEMLRRIAENDAVEALIVHINSPGGTTTASEELFNALRDVAAEKPVAALLGTTAASGGYIAALGADHIVARRTSITGSIGVLFQWPNVTELMDSIGVEVNTIKSAPLKAEPNPFEPTTEAAREALRSVVLDSYEWFVGLVRERRGLDEAALRQVADGRVYTGGQALSLGLVDALGDEDAVRAWLAAEHGIDVDTRVRDWEVDRGFIGFGATAAALAADALGLDMLARRIVGGWRLDATSLDGVVALWHPQLIEE